ncbi:MAG: alkaline phosphatase family protein, partial [Gammaproteobacteria bacterium]|nr:alkaline phosphatase family protein [Gammaproteobacteria bacterium]
MIRLFVVVLLGLSLAAPAETDAAKRMVLFGVDGMDPTLLQQFMDDGDMPNLKKLAAAGGFMPLATSIPAQSPVAWSDFITGMNPGGHGIFDFIALDRETMLPYLSSARVERSGREPLAIGRWRIPLSAEETVLMRDGQAFWEVLDEAGIPATIFRVPVNYPPIPAGERALSGMGTPDLRGTSGIFSFITTDPSRQSVEVSGGEIIVAKRTGTVIGAELAGPANAFLENAPRSVVPVTVHLDVEHPVALINIGDQRVLLNAGEWSDWIPVHFQMVQGLVDVPGMVRLFLKQVSPHLELYI